MRAININLENKEFNFLKKKKGELTWREFMLKLTKYREKKKK